MKKIALISIFLSVVVRGAFAAGPSTDDKKPLDHSVYDSWNSVSKVVVPNDGEWGYFTVTPQQGDNVLHLLNSRTGVEYTVKRGSTVVFSKDGTRAVFKIAPLYEETRQAKIKKKKAPDMPKDSLGVMNLLTGEVKAFPFLKSFRHAEEMVDFIAFQESEKPSSDKSDKKEPSKDTSASGKKPVKKENNSKNNLYVLNIKSFKVDTLKNVESFSFGKKTDRFAYVTKPGKKDSVTVRGIFLYEPSTGVSTEVMTGLKESAFGSADFNDDGTKLVFYAMPDTAKEMKKFTNVYLYENGKTTLLASQSSAGIPDGWQIADKRKISFYDNDTYITIGTRPVPREKDTTLVDFEQPKLDIWVWNEDYIQPIQKANLQRQKNFNYTALVYLNRPGEVVQLADETLRSVTIGEDNVQRSILETGDRPYRIQQQWDRNPCSDLYVVSLIDGSRKLIEERAPYTAFSTSPDGAYTVMYNSKDRNWYLFTLSTSTLKEITSPLGVNFWDEDNDTPILPSPCGGAVWSEDSRFVWIPDRFDIWQFDPAGKVAPFMVTAGQGRRTNTTYSFISPYNEPGKSPLARADKIKSGKAVYFSTFNHTTKERGFAMKDIAKKKSTLVQLAQGPFWYDNLSISTARKGSVLFFSKENFENGKDLWMTKDNFASQSRITEVNPQMKDYNWGTVELVNWTTEDGIRAEGLLFKPENFNPQKKYPVMIYFYEKYSDELFRSRVPAPSASTVNIPYFVSNEYICFIPDIYYKDGHPGKSCMKSLMPACDMLCEYSWIDGDNMAIQGQSWGGYQVAYIITQTDRFKAAGAGAPVSNMTSAYGGIRWESGLARTFQYEQTQSRIGDDLWHGFDLYVENSPLFFVPNVTTPVLIMHNDEDGAVPWWQGIEFFNGLRRCGKQAWMLQYNGEAHNLKERRNRKDLSIRLEQFFDHFLKGKPMPVWMESGVPATLKGIDLGYGFPENEKNQSESETE